MSENVSLFAPTVADQAHAAQRARALAFMHKHTVKEAADKPLPWKVTRVDLLRRLHDILFLGAHGMLFMRYAQKKALQKGNLGEFSEMLQVEMAFKYDARQGAQQFRNRILRG